MSLLCVPHIPYEEESKNAVCCLPWYATLLSVELARVTPMTQQQLVEVANHRARTASSCSVNNSFQTCLLQLSNVSLAASWLACRKPDKV